MIGRQKHCIALEDFSREEILEVLDLSVSMKEVLQRPIKKVPSLRGKSIVNLFFEASTRTRSSFEIAAKVLSADALNWTAAASSVTKGETLVDTARNLEAMRPDVLVIRHSAGGAPRLVAERVGCAVVSAGDGAHEHPTQGLLDCFTLRERLGTLEGKVVAIVGDISHSRVARSNLHAMPKLGAKVRLCGPPTMIPPGVEALGASVHYDLREAVEGADAVIMLRIQHERIGDPLIPNTRECEMSPTMATVLPSSVPSFSRSVKQSRSPWLGCSWAPSPAEMTAQPTRSATSRGAPPEACRITSTSGRMASRFFAVSTSVSPLETEEPLEVQLSASAERILAAVSKELRVRVEASKNSVTTILPRSVGTFFSGRSSTSFMVPARSSTWSSSARSYSASAMQCLWRPITAPSSA